MKVDRNVLCRAAALVACTVMASACIEGSGPPSGAPIAKPIWVALAKPGVALDLGNTAVDVWNGRVYATDAHIVQAFDDATGQLLWRQEMPHRHGGFIKAFPDKLVVRSRSTYAFDLETGTRVGSLRLTAEERESLWHHEHGRKGVDDPTCSARVSNSKKMKLTLCLSPEAGGSLDGPFVLSARDLATNRMLWEVTSSHVDTSCPATGGGLGCTFSNIRVDGDSLYVSRDDRQIDKLDLRTGRLLGTYKRPTLLDPRTDRIADGIMFVVEEQTQYLAMQPIRRWSWLSAFDIDAQRALWRSEAFEDNGRGFRAIRIHTFNGGRIYVSTGAGLIAFQMRP